jgi:hypothetical protein
MQRPRWTWTHKYAVPMFVSSLIAVVLAGLGWIAALNLDRDGTDPEDPDSGIDECLLGRWRMLSHTERLEAGGVPLQLTLDSEGAVYEFREDGTGSGDYGDGTLFQSEGIGQTLPATVAGVLSFRYEAAGGTFQIVEMLSTDATFTIDFLGSPLESPYELSTTAPESYECEGDTIHFSANERGYTADYERI